MTEKTIVIKKKEENTNGLKLIPIDDPVNKLWKELMQSDNCLKIILFPI
ncbi:hypothetical protein ACJROX_01165 [Pseudalkalibacillus sp. A8]